jgi:hypothetical protein
MALQLEKGAELWIFSKTIKQTIAHPLHHVYSALLLLLLMLRWGGGGAPT